ncbi:MAG: biotin/lipoyl-containing protein [Anaerolineae bacterium]
MAERIEVTVNGTSFTVEIADLEQITKPTFEVLVNGRPYTVNLNKGNHVATVPAPAPASAPAPGAAPRVEPAAQPKPAAAAADGQGQRVTAPMPGKILSVAVKVGDRVQPRDTLCTLEAMKMEMSVAAPGAGTVREVHAQVGESVAHGDLLFVLE